MTTQKLHGKIRFGFDQRQCNPRGIVWRFGDPEQDDTAGRRKAAPENELTLSESEEHPFLVGADGDHIIVGNAWTPLGDREHIPPAFHSASRAGRGKFSSARNFMRS